MVFQHYFLCMSSKGQERITMEKAIVTGAGGFVGSNLCRNLIRQGHHVKAMVRPGGSTQALDGLDVEIIRGDIALDNGLNQDDFKNVDVVFHIAALFRQEGATREAFYNVNVNGTRRVLQHARNGGAKRFIHCSTAGVHGWTDQDKPADENAPFRAGDWYQETKLEAEQLALAWGKEHGLPITVIRPTAICGEGDLRFLKLFRAIHRRRFVMIGKGTHHYHFLHVDDLSQGFILAAEHEQAIGQVFIIAGPRSIPLNEVIQSICLTLQAPKPLLHIPVLPVKITAITCDALCKRIGIMPPLYPRRLDFFTKHRSFDARKAATMLGYTPRIQPEEALARMGAWYQKNHIL
jgi:nucleoside-diphosphate-sugar epimerase